MVVITMTDIMQLESTHTSGVYPKRPLTIVRGEGAYLFDDAGNRYIDCVGGQGSANLGHSHPAVVAAIREQAGVLLNLPEIFYNDKRAALLKKLTALAGMNRAICATAVQKQLRRRSSLRVLLP